MKNDNDLKRAIWHYVDAKDDESILENREKRMRLGVRAIERIVFRPEYPREMIIRRFTTLYISKEVSSFSEFKELYDEFWREKLEEINALREKYGKF